MIPSALTCDIFCRVVDNYGDIGVSWRLARQLSRERQMPVRLIVDDLASLGKLVPQVTASRREQIVEGITVVEWREPFTLAPPAALVIEAFACELPAAYIADMARLAIKPVWINLEYLSAESWVEAHHLLPSPHASYPLTKHFFFPGFTLKTGGLIRESGLPKVKDAVDRASDATVLRVLIFAYENSPAEALVSAMGKMARQVRCQLSGGNPDINLKHWRALQTKNDLQGAPVLEVDVMPFVPQGAFDALLREQDVLFVRGEDSLVRAVWAGKPFVWQIYPQPQNAHRVKLEAFLDLYCAGLSQGASGALRGLWHAWNAVDAVAIEPCWKAFYLQLDELRSHARCWSIRQSKLPDLASNLLSFYQKTVKI